MLSKVLFFICLSIVLQCALLQSIDDEENKTGTDRWIEETLHGNRRVRQCVNVVPKKTTPSYSQDGKPSWTVVIVRQEPIVNISLPFRHCTGSLIGLKVVLTAASCVLDVNKNKFQVLAGEWTAPRAGCKERIQRRRVETIATPKKYPLNSIPDIRDIALLFLADPFRENCYVSTICLAPSSLKYEDLYNVQCSISGWKHREERQHQYERFVSLNTRVVSNKDCTTVLQKTVLGGSFTVTGDFMCATTESDPHLLLGNGGAPLVCQVCEPRAFVQFGVLSYGFGSSSLPLVLTPIRKYISWILRECRTRNAQLTEFCNQS